jgi:hypothetical protein
MLATAKFNFFIFIIQIITLLIKAIYELLQ